MKNIIITFLFLLFASAMFAQSLYDYPNQLNYSHFPENSNDTPNFFSSTGAWFGIGLPQAYQSDKFGQFAGPYSTYTNNWFSTSILDFNFGITGKGKIELATATNIETDQYPGLLVQKYHFEDYRIEEKLMFISGRTCLLKIDAINTSQDPMQMSMMLQGSAFEELGEAESFTDGWMYKIDNKDDILWLIRFRLDKEMDLSYSPQDYEFSYKSPISVMPSDTLSIVATISQYFKGDIQQDVEMASDALYSPEKYFKKNVNLWDYLTSKITSDDSDLRKLSVKSIQTLYLNLRSYIPSFQNFFFVESTGISSAYINTDESWLYSSALLRFDIRLSLQSIASNLKNLNNDGSLNKYIGVLNTISTDSTLSENPMAAWTTWNFYSMSPDIKSLLQIYPMLEKHHNYWYEYRDSNNNLWCEDINGIETVKLNAMLFSEKYCLMKLSEELEYTEKAKMYKLQIDSIKTVFNKHFFDMDLISYVNINIVDKSKTEDADAVGYCLWAGIASWDIANIYAENVQANIDSGYYQSLFKSGKFDIEYYYYLIAGLKQYKHVTESERLKELLLQQILKNAFSKPIPSFESAAEVNYNNSSLTSAILLLLINY